MHIDIFSFGYENIFKCSQKLSFNIDKRWKHEGDIENR